MVKGTSEEKPHQQSLRGGRYDESGLYYFLTTVTKERMKLLSEPAAADIVLDSLRWLDRDDRIMLITAVVMPDHLHFIACLKTDSLPRLMHSLKSYTANEINKALGRKGRVWERQYYERVIRDETSLNGIIQYCLENPVRKRLVSNYRDYKYWFCVYDF